MNDYQIHDAIAVIVKDRKLLVCREKGHAYLVSPGGGIEQGETPAQTLIRELGEELGIKVQKKDIKFFKTYYGEAVGKKNQIIRAETFFVHAWQGKIKPTSDIEEIAWLTSKVPAKLKIGNIFRKEVIPYLKEKNLIDL